MRKYWSAALAALVLTGCTVDPHRSFYGPRVKPLWSIHDPVGYALLIHEGIAYMSAAPPDSDRDKAQRLYALDLKSGKQLWVSDFVPASRLYNSAVNGVVLILGYPSGSDKVKTSHLYALDGKSGKQRWVSKLVTEDIVFLMASQICVTERVETPDRVRFVPHLLDQKTGEEITSPTLPPFRTAAVVENTLYTISSGAIISAMDTPTHVLWTAHLPDSDFQGPVVSGNTVYYYCVSADDSKGCLTPTGGINKDSGIYAFDRKTGALRWKWNPDNYKFTGIEADPDTLFISAYNSTGVAIALDAATGNQKWSKKLTWNGKDWYFRRNSSRPLLVDAATVVFLDQPSPENPGFDSDHLENKGMGYVVHGFKRATGEPVWHSRLRWKYDDWELKDGLLFASDGGPHDWTTSNYKHQFDRWFNVIDIRTGEELWRSKVASLASFSTPKIGDGIVVVTSIPRGKNSPTIPEIFAFRATRTGK